MQVKRLFALCIVLVALVACATLPTGYEALRTEVNLVEGSKYILALRDQYIVAYQRGVLNPEQFALAVKADETLTAVWNQLVEVVAAKQDDYALYVQVLKAEAKLESLLVAWIPGYQPPAKPAVLK